MYDELVKRLREAAEYGPCIMDRKDAIEAADAIEELQQQVEHYHGCMNDWFEAAQEYKAQIPRWIPVAERLPKADDIVIVAIHDDSGDTPYDVTNVGFYLDVFPLGIWVVENERCNYVTHWMPLPEPPKELIGTDMRGGIRRDDAGNVIDWGITGPPGDVGKTEEE